MVASACLKIVLENNWTLEKLEQEDALSFARLPIQRSHLRQPFARVAEAG